MRGDRISGASVRDLVHTARAWRAYMLDEYGGVSPETPRNVERRRHLLHEAPQFGFGTLGLGGVDPEPSRPIGANPEARSRGPQGRAD
jgi:hypothetical protein